MLKQWLVLGWLLLISCGPSGGAEECQQDALNEEGTCKTHCLENQTPCHEECDVLHSECEDLCTSVDCLDECEAERQMCGETCLSDRAECEVGCEQAREAAFEKC